MWRQLDPPQACGGTRVVPVEVGRVPLGGLRPEQREGQRGLAHLSRAAHEGHSYRPPGLASPEGERYRGVCMIWSIVHFTHEQNGLHARFGPCQITTAPVTGDPAPGYGLGGSHSSRAVAIVSSHRGQTLTNVSFAEGHNTSAFARYLLEGGFPQAQGPLPALRIELLQGYTDTVLLRGVVGRCPVAGEELIQVCADVAAPETRARELRALNAAAEADPRANRLLLVLDRDALARAAAPGARAEIPLAEREQVLPAGFTCAGEAHST